MYRRELEDDADADLVNPGVGKMLKMLKKKMKMLKMMLEGRPFGLSSDSESFTLVGEIGFLPILAQVGHEDLY